MLTTGQVVLRLLEAASGSVVFDEWTTSRASARERGGPQRMQIVFQDPYAPLNPS